MSTYDEAYNQMIADLLAKTLKEGFAQVELPEVKPQKQKLHGSRNAIKRLKKARKQSK